MTQPLSLKAPAADRIAGAVGPFLIAVVVITLAVIFHQFAAPLAFNEAAFQNLGTVFAPLFAIAAFIERAVEVLVTPYRAGHSDILQQRLVNIAADPAQGALADELRERIVAYKAESQQIAFRL